MPRIPVHNIGAGGIIKDIPPHLLPPEVWSNGQNVRFQDGKVVKFTGHEAVFDPPSIAPYWALAAQTATDQFWLYAGLAKVFTVEQDGTHTDITRASGDYTGVAADLWDGTVFAGIPVITNGVDDPQSWSPIAAATALVDLPNWPANTTCKHIRAFKNFLVALHITESGTVKPHMIKWSHTTDPGSVPSSWDDTDATKDAGERELIDSQAGIIQDALGLRDILLIYKDNSIWGMQHIGGRFIFRTFPMFGQTGILTSRCVAALANSEQHLVMTGDDLVVHNGQDMESVITRRWKRFINDNLDPTNFPNSYVVGNPLFDEMWFCFPEIGATFPTLAITLNVKDGAVGVRELSDAAFLAQGVVSVTGAAETWDSDSDSWDSDTTRWEERGFFPQALTLLQVDPTNTKLFQLDKSDQFDGSNMTSFIERQGIALAGVDRAGNPKVDVSVRKLLRRIWIKADGGPFEVLAGSQQFIDGPITYETAVSFDPATDQYVDACSSGPLLAVKFQSSADVAWALHAYDLDVEILGEL